MDALAALRDGQLLAGYLRINSKRPRQEAYVPVAGLPRDVFVEGDADRNRALDGDLVAIELLPEATWLPARAPKTRSLESLAAADRRAAATAAAGAAAEGRPRASGAALAALSRRAETDIERALEGAAASELSQRLWQPLADGADFAGSDGAAGSASAVAASAASSGAPASFAKPLPPQVADAVAHSTEYAATVARVAAAADGGKAKAKAGAAAPTSKSAAAGGAGSASLAAAAPADGDDDGDEEDAAGVDAAALQPRGRVVCILAQGHPRAVVGRLLPGDDAHPLNKPIPDRQAYVRLVRSYPAAFYRYAAV